MPGLEVLAVRWVSRGISVRNIARIPTVLRLMGVVVALMAFPGLCSLARQPQRSTQTFPTMSAAIDAIGEKYGVHVGLEYAAQDPDRLPITLDLSASAIATVFDSLVAQKPAYVWKFDGRV